MTMMSLFRIALANLPFPASREASVAMAGAALGEAAAADARLVCFPECFVPGYRGMGHTPAPADPPFLEHAWETIAEAARRGNVAAVVGTERLVDGELRISALAVDAKGRRLGFQDKVQLDPSEEGTYSPGSGRAVFETDGLRFGVVICHEGWRYPETVREAVRRGARVVFHPHLHEAEPGSYRPARFMDPLNSFHEKAMLCRAAENTCYFASVNYASAGSPTTSAVVDPEGGVAVWQPYGQAGLLLADLDLERATGFLASRWKVAR